MAQLNMRPVWQAASMGIDAMSVFVYLSGRVHDLPHRVGRELRDRAAHRLERRPGPRGGSATAARRRRRGRPALAVRLA